MPPGTVGHRQTVILTDGCRVDAADVKLIPSARRLVTIAANCSRRDDDDDDVDLLQRCAAPGTAWGSVMTTGLPARTPLLRSVADPLYNVLHNTPYENPQ